MHDPIAEALGMRPLGFSIDPNEGRDPNETNEWRQGGYINEAMYEYLSIKMTKDNPMKNPETAKKVSDSIKKSFESGKRKARKLTDEERQMHSERMKKNNPAHTHPDKHNFKNNSYVKGRKWYNNGEKNLYLYEDEEVPEGFVPGMKYVPRKKKD